MRTQRRPFYNPFIQIHTKIGHRHRGRFLHLIGARPDEAEWRTFMVACKQFKQDGTGSHIDNVLLKEFPLFHGKAPAGHPYPQAFKDGATDTDYCYIECVDHDLDSLVLLCRKLPSGRVISIDTCNFAMLNGSAGIAHLNMNNGDNRVENLKLVNEDEARKLLMEF